MICQVFIKPFFTITEDDPVIEISDILQNRLNITQKEWITIKLGGEKLLVKSKTLSNPSEVDTIFLNQACYSRIDLPCVPLKLQAICDHDCLILGPIIAILTEIKMNKENIPLFPTIETFCKELHEISTQQGGLIFVSNISRFPKNGFIYNGSWQEQLVPKANILYNRIHSRQIERNPHFQFIKNKWEKDGINIFNASFLTKWKTQNILLKNKNFHTYLPMTTLLNTTDLKKWIHKYKDLYIKPDTGSQGRQIIHCYKKHNLYHIEQTSFSNTTNISYTSLDDVVSQIQTWIGTKTFIIQQTIPLVQIGNKKIDFRFLCHKKKQNIWSITSSVARISEEKHFVSNIAQGGTISRPEKILTTVFGKETAKQTYSLMSELALEIATFISSESEGLIGELGIDIGVDFQGKPWVIEVNSKPSKQSESDSLLIRPSAKAIYYYCTELWLERSKLNDKIRDIDNDTL
ncbi:hypothetical protein J6TS2_05070 [Heyndrickxia sporothermodurans]|nr:hypothetical protein J6TS2_05070 [Heyndrickxia sporothermodurans]